MHTPEYYAANRPVVDVPAQGSEDTLHDEQNSRIISYSSLYIPGKTEILRTLVTRTNIFQRGGNAHLNMRVLLWV
jgi:hypothetical protein